jgi:hypothetical protein
MNIQILPILVFLLVIGVYSTSQNSIPIYGQTTNTTTLIEKGEEEQKKVELLSHKIRNGSSSIGYSSDKLIGQVHNMLDKDVELVQIIATYYDANGEMIGSSTTFTQPTALKPNMKAPFEILLDEDIANELKAYDITITWRQITSELEGIKEFSNTYELSQQQLQQHQSSSNNNK